MGVIVEVRATQDEFRGGWFMATVLEVGAEGRGRAARQEGCGGAWSVRPVHRGGCWDWAAVWQAGRQSGTISAALCAPDPG